MRVLEYKHISIGYVNSIAKLGIAFALEGRKLGTLMSLFYFLSIGVMVMTFQLMY
ncbi:MAG: hypothetical protein OQK45_09390 [Sulfurovum sp.]|nr:hypothetical protein [Sulfurovum sp.]